MKNVITIDGPVCSGKGTVAQGVAKELGLFYFSSGDFYRAVGICVEKEQGFDEEKFTEEVLEEFLKRKDFRADVLHGVAHYYYKDQEITDELKTELASACAFWVAKIPQVRNFINEEQRRIAGEISLVVDGRDEGTVVFPDATLKIFLTADVEVRARRRTEQAQAKGEDVTYEEVLALLEARDASDAKNTQPAEDAIIVDTTSRLIEDEISEIVKLFTERTT